MKIKAYTCIYYAKINTNKKDKEKHKYKKHKHKMSEILPKEFVDNYPKYFAKKKMGNWQRFYSRYQQKNGQSKEKWNHQ